MASVSILQRLNQRAKQAESMIAALKKQIEIIRQNAGLRHSELYSFLYKICMLDIKHVHDVIS